ncbi:multicopper oxidase family protein [Nocardioidaceae bacterium SCSIO 66511]|nr:multicopper oxidase family protein [Nocardioidaceae bacterium SCSIO 66511]
MTIDRRRFIGLSSGLIVASALPGCALTKEYQTGAELSSTAELPKPFSVPLPIPRVAQSQSRGGADHVEITQRTAEVEILPGKKTPILGYDGEFPGPTIVSRSGTPTVVRHTNKLDIPVVVHLHGGHTPSESDGFPIDFIMPEGSHQMPHGHAANGQVKHGHFAYEYPMKQRAATLWYHDHRMDFTGPTVYHGLAGFHLIHDDEEDALPLPKGDRDVPLMITDRAFDGDGTFLYPALDPTMHEEPGVEDAYMAGVLGDVVLVNGAPWPELEVEAARYRFRILNASNARRYRLQLDPGPADGDPFIQIGSDGGLLAKPHELEEIVIAPAERFDVIIDFARYDVGDTVTMRNGLGDGSTADVMRFRVVRKANDDSAIPDRLSEIEELDADAATVTREFEFTQAAITSDHDDMWLINGKPYDPERVDAKPTLGEVEIWRFITDVHHPVHVHLDPFQVLRRGGTGPGPYDEGWKDTVDIRPGEAVEVAIRFEDYAGMYVMHCHNLEHEDMMMMSNFETR